MKKLQAFALRALAGLALIAWIPGLPAIGLTILFEWLEKRWQGEQGK